ncbi:BREX-1 system adenine-specific DNA-methyltransferase PglX [Peribacillus simplex]|uniref:BREX-1 system adenine-specific DNA-methyltransferase PglX n=1 Tax=Peribacillus simplex TaxID=1478 RepID=UPI000BA5AF50|nr:BREX-1 system adenine-specific DNA-methyltransferase PglX [Peribacillus simplex]PAK40594.1 SAM-dependent methyltransferase [Peribacillus simplex]
MNKSALKTFATSARKELLKKVEAKAMKIGITEETIKKADIESSDAIFIDGKQLSKEEKIQRDNLIARITQIGFNQVMEEVAYTWFNRFTALRFMEVNNYLPTGVRVLSSSNSNSADPDMINEALELDLVLDKEYVYELKLNNKTEELFKYLIIKHCNDLNRYLPFMFKTIDDYTEILFPEGLLAKDSFIRQMTDTKVILENNWQKVEVIGWLYQYYIAEEKDRVIKAKKKYITEEIPFATQLFTPDWIVRYMVQNSLGRYWVESHPEHMDLLDDWEFYLENPNLEPDFLEKLTPYINNELKVEDIKCFDPAMGSGHILVYMFDVLYEIYNKCGYMEREIPRLIIENNLHGLDIDDRAYQLACFSVVMKALEYNSRFFRSIEREGLNHKLASIQETNILNDEDIAYIAGEDSGVNLEKTKVYIELFRNAKTIGSLIKVSEYDKKFLLNRLLIIQNNPAKDLFEDEKRKKVLTLLPELLKQSEIMYKDYDILVTNPPYMGSKYMNKVFSDYVFKYYNETRYDLFSAFIQYCTTKVIKSGQIGLMTPFVWMFNSASESLRTKLIKNCTISSLIQLEYSAFEEATVPICTFTIRNEKLDIAGQFIKLSEFRGTQNQPLKTLEAIQDPMVKYRYSAYSNDFKKIPGNLIVYWLSDSALKLFEEETISKYITTREGMTTADNDKFLREWYEVPFEKIGFGISNEGEAMISKKKWFPYQKGGSYRKWYGNLTKVVNWEHSGFEIKNNIDQETGRIRSHNYNGEYGFREGLTFPTISSGKFGARYSPKGMMFDTKGAMGFFDSSTDLFIILALMNTTIAQYYLTALAPTLDFKLNKIMSIPALIPEKTEEVIQICKECIEISKTEWDIYETSWDFKTHPFFKMNSNFKKIELIFEDWMSFTKKEFERLKKNEESINYIFIDAFSLQDEIDINVNEEDIRISIANRERDIKSFISYALGCIFGRYSLNKEGLVYAGGKFNLEKYQKFNADKDNILPILPGAYFEDDIVSRFIDFVQVTFGEETLAENLDFIADTLGKKRGETSKETIRRYFLNDFFKDHVQTYKKRPIYWLFTSGKQKAFNCLIYMHRYDKTTLSRIRIDYLHEYQIRLDGERKSLLNIIEGDSTAKEISNAKKELKTLDKKIEELKEYDELLHHMADMQIEIDLDDGVGVNYEKFKGLVAKL